MGSEVRFFEKENYKIPQNTVIEIRQIFENDSPLHQTSSRLVSPENSRQEHESTLYQFLRRN